jgi:2-hydroxy-6-oxonona-2,4-dienedioate hydrolase
MDCRKIAMFSRRLLLGLGLAAGTLVTAGTSVSAKFAETLRFHRARVSKGSEVLASRYGQIEYAKVGHGEPVLIVHGAGGGFDQAITFASRLIGAGHQIIAPSRFGYLRSSNPSDPSPENQADAFAALLDALHIQNVAVVGVSAGAPSVLQFVVRHGHRCRSLTLVVPAASAAGKGLKAQGPLPTQGPASQAITELILTSDFLFWLGIMTARDRMIRTVLATDPALVAAAIPEERQRAYDILWTILPLSMRWRGIVNDTRITSTPLSIDLENIRAPTLVISLEDDLYGTIAPARLIATRIPGARLLTYASGGHVMIGHEAELLAELDAFLRQY